MTPHTLTAGTASGDLHPGPANEQLAFSYAPGYLRGRTNPGNPGKLETDEKSGQGLTSRNFSPRNSNPKHTCPSSLIVLQGRRCSLLIGMHNGNRPPPPRWTQTPPHCLVSLYCQSQQESWLLRPQNRVHWYLAIFPTLQREKGGWDTARIWGTGLRKPAAPLTHHFGLEGWLDLPVL